MNNSDLRECDIVMKGGITSGVVYPGAVVELAKKFRFVNVGGTSAGAIAAAACAAAELGRGKPGAGFGELSKLPQELGEDVGGGRSRLLSLFHPNPATADLYALGMTFMMKGKGAAIGLAIRQYWRRLLPALLPLAVAGAVALIVGFLGWPGWLVAFLAMALVLGGLWYSAKGVYPKIEALIADTGKCFVDNGYGLCTGHLPEGSHPPPLTDWLEALYNRLAGRPADAPEPLTFAELEKAKINLVAMTTCLTLGRPYRLPFRDDKKEVRENIFYFRPDEWQRYFSPRIIDWLLKNERSTGDAETRKEFNAQGYYALPETTALPIVVAVRMSLSFPGLLCAVPLHTRHIPFGQALAAKAQLRRCWFSDGGICSNFPIHFFESPLPRRPTFGLNLLDVGEAEDEMTYLPRSNKGGVQHVWDFFGKTPALGFGWSILNTARNWPDTVQTTMPGYRDRIGHVKLTPTEGGLNLTMASGLINTLSERGREVAAELARRYGNPSPKDEPKDVDLTWSNHRHVRLRSFLASAEELLEQFDKACATPQAHDMTYDELIDTPRPGKTTYRWNVDQVPRAHALLKGLRALAQQQPPNSEPVKTGVPNPRAELRMRPRI